MCLVTKQICPIKARKDIVVYKVLAHFITFERNKYITPFRSAPVKLHSTLYARGYIDKRKIEHRSAHTMYEIGCGYIHCYTSVGSLHRNYLVGINETIVKCIIRKGTLYYKSHDGTQICATHVDILDEIGLNY